MIEDFEASVNFETFVSGYLHDVLKFHGQRFKTYNASLQQQIQHLSFVSDLVCNRGLLQTILDQHKIIKVKYWYLNSEKLF